MFQKSIAPISFAQTSVLYYGFPKVGKTTIASLHISKGKPPAFIMTEDGEGELSIDRIRVTTWEGFKRLVKLLEKDKDKYKSQYSCFVVDLISELDDWCSRYVADKLKIKHISDADYGKGFALQKEEFQVVIAELLSVLPCVFIAHSQEKPIIWHGEKITTQGPSLSKGSFAYINGKVDTIAWFKPKSGKEMKCITMKNSTTNIAGSRFKQLNREFPLYPNDPAKTYAEIETAFFGKEAQ